jgi:20S proteasome alpha/beta subunit
MSFICQSEFKEASPNASLMTFIVGSKCVDGVVVVADRKIMILNKDSLNFDYKKKLFAELRHVAFGSSGSTGNYELFRSHVKSHIRKNDVSIDDISLVLSDITFNLNERYKYRYETTFEVLVGIAYKDRDSSLTYINPYGSLETVDTFKAIGAGAKYAKAYLENSWNSQMTMEQFAELGYFIIRCIEKFRLEGSVGLDNEHPQVWYMPNCYTEDEQGNVIKNDDRESSNEELDRISIRVERRLKKHERQLAKLFDSKSFRT